MADLTDDQRRKVQDYVRAAAEAAYEKLREVDIWFSQEFPGLMLTDKDGVKASWMRGIATEASASAGWLGRFDNGTFIFPNRNGVGWDYLVENSVSPELLEAAEQGLIP